MNAGLDGYVLRKTSMSAPVALPGDEADDRDRAGRVAGLHEGAGEGGVEEVERYKQKAPADQSVVLDQQSGELLPLPRGLLPARQCVEHGHEVRLAGAERPVQVGGLRAVPGDRRLDQSECGRNRPADRR
ncbi:hypothetical protein ACWDOR_04495 [Streptosporangium canum]|uniref:hypothetical protein n=1 Tax=Streptosporangium canum TaxID=324952 RepID=UPI0036ADD703